jgi:hypothetical protein
LKEDRAGVFIVRLRVASFFQNAADMTNVGKENAAEKRALPHALAASWSIPSSELGETVVSPPATLAIVTLCLQRWRECGYCWWHMASLSELGLGVIIYPAVMN